MTVYIDDMRRPAQVGSVVGTWSHLMATTTEELVAFAKRLGLRESWIQYPGTPKEHFDVTDAKRTLALRLGAVPIGYGEAGHLTLAKRRNEPFDLVELRARTGHRSQEPETLFDV